MKPYIRTVPIKKPVTFSAGHSKFL